MAASPSRWVARYSCILLLVLTGFVGCGDDTAPARHPAGMGASGAEGGEAGSGTGAQPGGEGGAPAPRGGSGGSAGTSGAGGADAGEGGASGGSVNEVGHMTLTLLTLPGEPVRGASVAIGSLRLTSDIAGKVSFDVSRSATVIAKIEHDDFATAARPIEVLAALDLEQDVWLARRGPPLPFLAERGLRHRETSVQLTIPPDSLVDENGDAVTGPVTVRLAPIAGTPEALRAAPGAFVGDRNGEQSMLDSLGMLEVTLRRGDERLDLAPSALARIALPIPLARQGDAPAGTVIPLWSFDETLGHWLHEGGGTVLPDPQDSNRTYWAADVEHFSSWNQDFELNDGTNSGSACLDIAVVDDETDDPLPAAMTSIQGIDYGGHDVGPVGADGSRCARVPAERRLTVTATVRGYYDPAPQEVSGRPEGLCSDGSCTPITIRLRPTHCLSGEVQDGSGFGVAGAAVVARWTTLNSNGVVTLTSDGSGKYCANVPRAASVTVSATRDVNGTLEHSQEESLNTPAAKASCGGGNCRAVPALRFVGACLRGTVRNSAGDAVSGARVVASYQENGAPASSVATSDGSGSYCMRVTKGVLARVHAESTTGTRTRFSASRDVQLADEAQACGSTACADAPELIVLDSTCIEGQAQDSSGQGVEDASISGDLGYTYDFAQAHADTDANGNYCLEVPARASVAITATRDRDGLLENASTIAFAPSASAECGSGQCATAPPVLFDDQSCVSGRIVDGDGNPWVDANVELVIQVPDVGRTDVHPDVGLDGSFCVGAYPSSRVQVTADRRSAGRRVEATASVQVPALSRAACGGSCPTTPDLVLPRSGCITGTVLDSAGMPAGPGDAFIGVLDASGALVGSTAFTDTNGAYCLDLPQATNLSLESLNFNTSAHAARAFRMTSGAETTCTLGGCQAVPTLSLVETACLSGDVVDGVGAATAEAEVWVYYEGLNGSVVQTLTPTVAGSFCAQVPVGVDVDLVARGIGGTVRNLGAARHVRASTTTGTCGACTASVELALRPVTPCVRGIAYARGSDELSHPVAAGIPITVYDSSTPPAPVCTAGSDTPPSWGQVVGTVNTLQGGAFCAELSAFPSANRAALVFGNCAFQSAEPLCLKQTKLADFRDEGGCSATCVDVGAVYLETQGCR